MLNKILGKKRKEKEIIRHLKSMDPETAVKYIDSILQNKSELNKKTIAFLNEELKSAYKSIAERSIKLGDTDLAFNCYKKLGLSDTESFLRIGEAYHRLKAYVPAANAYLKINEYVFAAENFAKAGMDDEAEKCIKKAKSMGNSSSSSSLRNLEEGNTYSSKASLLERKGDYKAAAENWAKAYELLKNTTTYGFYALRAAECYEKTRNYRMAAKFYHIIGGRNSMLTEWYTKGLVSKEDIEQDSSKIFRPDSGSKIVRFLNMLRGKRE